MNPLISTFVVSTQLKVRCSMRVQSSSVTTVSGILLSRPALRKYSLKVHGVSKVSPATLVSKVNRDLKVLSVNRVNQVQRVLGANEDNVVSKVLSVSKVFRANQVHKVSKVNLDLRVRKVQLVKMVKMVKTVKMVRHPTSIHSSKRYVKNSRPNYLKTMRPSDLI